MPQAVVPPGREIGLSSMLGWSDIPAGPVHPLEDVAHEQAPSQVVALARCRPQAEEQRAAKGEWLGIRRQCAACVYGLMHGCSEVGQGAGDLDPGGNVRCAKGRQGPVQRDELRRAVGMGDQVQSPSLPARAGITAANISAEDRPSRRTSNICASASSTTLSSRPTSSPSTSGAGESPATTMSSSPDRSRWASPSHRARSKKPAAWQAPPIH